MLGPSIPQPYCGAPPDPAEIWSRWNLDPVLIGVLLAALGLYLFAARGPRRPATYRIASFALGWATAAAALVSPLCPLSVSLFSARVGQHMALSLVAAPLLLLGAPGTVLASLFPASGRRLAGSKIAAGLRSPAGAAVAFTLALWFWHAPAPYAATFSSPLAYWLMHLTVFGAALLVWNVLLGMSPARVVAAIVVGAISTVQMTFLGALITLTPRLLYAPHAVTPYAWGLTQAADQQIGGLIMWVPGCTIFLTATLVSLARVMGDRAHSGALA